MGKHVITELANGRENTMKLLKNSMIEYTTDAEINRQMDLQLERFYNCIVLMGIFDFDELRFDRIVMDPSMNIYHMRIFLNDVKTSFEVYDVYWDALNVNAIKDNPSTRKLGESILAIMAHHLDHARNAATIREHDMEQFYYDYRPPALPIDEDL